MKNALTLFLTILATAAARAQMPLFSTNSVSADSAGLTGITHEASSTNRVRFVSSSSRFLSLSYEGGYILPVDDKEEVNNLLRESNYRTITFRSSWDVPATSVYSSLYRKPKLGLGISLVNFNHPALGKPVTMFGFTEIPITNARSRWIVSYGIGGGIGFAFHHYSKTSNPGNMAIGSSVNAYLEANFHAGYWITDKFILSAGTGYRHYSNGSTKQPNAGINIIPFHVSLRYQAKKIDYHTPPMALPEFKKNFSVSVYNGSGMKQLEMDGRMIFKNLTGLNAGYQFSYKYRVAAGFDITYSSGGSERVPGNASGFSKHFSYGPYLGWEWFLTDRIYVPIYAGVYIHRNYENDETNQFYQRLGLRYLLLKNRQLSVGVGLKTHFGQADFVEFGLGYHLR